MPDDRLDAEVVVLAAAKVITDALEDEADAIAVEWWRLGELP